MQQNYLIFIIIFVVLQLSRSIHIIKETWNHNTRSDFIKSKQASQDHLHKVIFAIKQNNLDILEEILYDVSSVESQNYGNHKSFEFVGNLIENREGTNVVSRWLQDNGVVISSIALYGEYITCSAPISLWEDLFMTTFHEYHGVLNNEESGSKLHPVDVIIRTEVYSLPDHVIHHVHTVFNTINLPPRKFSRGKVDDLVETQEISKDIELNEFSIQANSLPGFVTPSALFSIYDITIESNTSTALGTQAIYGSNGQTFLSSDLSSFESKFNIPIDAVDSYSGHLPDPSVCNVDLTSCVEATLDIEYILAIGQGISTTYWYDDTEDGSFLTFIVNISSNPKPANIYSISYVLYENDLTDANIALFNIEAIKLGVRGVTLIAATGDDGVTGFGYTSYKNSSQCGYYAQWPASSPYVTAVGGTMNGDAIVSSTIEIACSSISGSAITTGGGFSNRIPAPSFQLNAINNYTSKYNGKQSSQQSYNTSNRGYPDISLAANKYAIFIGGSIRSVSGTSASAPTFAGMVGLLNNHRLHNGLSVVGWMNPTIYSNNGQFANDITSGNNSCTRKGGFCCSIGFQATSGWDPVTGFGSINFTSFLNYYTIYAPTFSPTTHPTIVPSPSPTNIPTVRPSKTPTSPPTFQPMIHYSSYTKISIVVIQSFFSQVSANFFITDLAVIQSFSSIIQHIFINSSLLSVNINNATDGTISRRLHEKQVEVDISSTVTDINVEYTLNFVYVSDTIQPSVNSVKVFVLNQLNSSINSGEFTSLLNSSSSPIVSSLACVSNGISISTASVSEYGTTDEQNNKTLSIGAIIGIAVGGFCLVVILILLFVYCIRKSMGKRNSSDSRTNLQVDRNQEKYSQVNSDIGTLSIDMHPASL